LSSPIQAVYSGSKTCTGDSENLRYRHESKTCIGDSQNLRLRTRERGVYRRFAKSSLTDTRARPCIGDSQNLRLRTREQGVYRRFAKSSLTDTRARRVSAIRKIFAYGHKSSDRRPLTEGGGECIISAEYETSADGKEPPPTAPERKAMAESLPRQGRESRP
jgi:hypothetical protein